MNPAELLRAGNLAEALKALEGEIRGNPTDVKKRIFLFQLLCVMGNYERAITQLKVITDLDAATLLMAQVCGPALAAESLRAEIFAGKRTPLLLGEPEEWLGWLIQSHKHLADGEYGAAKELQDKAFEAAPGTSGTVNGQAFEWISDADRRFGPVLEAIIDGKYYWVPMHCIQDITIEAPKDLRDLVWLPAIMTLAAGGQKVALLPARYPGTAARGSDRAKLGRITEWERIGGIDVAVGQKLLETETSEVGLLDVRKIVLNVVPAAGEVEAGGEGEKSGAAAGAEG